MDNFEKIFKIVSENNGYIRTKDLLKEDIDRKYLSILVEEGHLYRVERGLYSIINNPFDIFYTIQNVNKKVRFSLNTALYLNNLSDRTPLIIDVSLPYNYAGSLLKDKRVNINFINGDLLDYGSNHIKSPFNNDIIVYDKERTICDIIKYKNKIDSEVFSNALKNYINSKDKDLNKLSKYSKRLNVEKRLNNYLEVLLWWIKIVYIIKLIK